jgi:GT2 family glycosyltransferase
MVSFAAQKDVGCVGAKLYYPNSAIQHAGVILGIGGVAGHSHKYFPPHEAGYFSRLKLLQNVSAVTGACLVVRKEIYFEVGGLEQSLRVAFNDVDFCLKVREAGYRNVWTPYAELYHHESVSRGYEVSRKQRKRFRNEIAYMQEKWGDALSIDPFYSPHLTLDREDFSIRESKRPQKLGANRSVGSRKPKR